jgi:WD40 repeat protein
MEKISTLTGHTFRVLYLAMSPDGASIVTTAAGAGAAGITCDAGTTAGTDAGTTVVA